MVGGKVGVGDSDKDEDGEGFSEMIIHSGKSMVIFSILKGFVSGKLSGLHLVVFSTVWS